jgi:dephospho-CoA kinase
VHDVRAIVRALLGGGIGSGKSAAASVFAGLGATIVSADEAGRDVLTPGSPATEAVAERWPLVMSADGTVDRAALARLVFADQAELRELERITHPAILRSMALRLAEVSDAPAVVVEIPLPGDWLGPGWARIVVDAPDDVRVQRLLERGMTEDEIARRMSAQPTRLEWLESADHVIDNSGDRSRLEAECRRVWAALVGGGTTRTPR